MKKIDDVKKYTCIQCGLTGGSTVLFRNIESCTLCVVGLLEKAMNSNENLREQVNDTQDRFLKDELEIIEMLNGDIQKLAKQLEHLEWLFADSKSKVCKSCKHLFDEDELEKL